MEAMLADAPAGPAEALISVLCVEATPKAQETLERAMQSSSSSSPAVALQTLRQMPGTRLRVSPYTTVHVLRGFLSSQEAGPTSSAAGGRASNEKNGASRGALANAQFFAVRAPDSADVVQGEGEKDDETLVALPDSATLQEVLSCGHALQLPAEATEAGTAPPEMTLVLLYARESQYGDMDGGDILCIGLCAALCACCVACCVSQAASAASERKQQQQQQKYQEQQQHVQQQPPYYNNQNQQGEYQNNYNNNQNYYQGQAGAPNSYGTPPPASGYPVAQPGYYNYSGDPALAQPQPPQPQYYNNPGGNQYQQGYYQQPNQPNNDANCHGASPL
jgi:hypothetical protein